MYLKICHCYEIHENIYDITVIFQHSFFCSKADYHKLIGVAAELVDSLEDTVRGKMVSVMLCINWKYYIVLTTPCHLQRAVFCLQTVCFTL